MFKNAKQPELTWRTQILLPNKPNTKQSKKHIAQNTSVLVAGTLYCGPPTNMAD